MEPTFKIVLDPNQHDNDVKNFLLKLKEYKVLYIYNLQYAISDFLV
jgi:hypothetical protein